MEENEYETIDLLELLMLIKQNIVGILLCTLLCAAGAFAISRFLIVPQYQAVATLIVNTRQENSTVVTNDNITSARNLVSTYSIIIKSDSVLQPVIDELGLNLTYEELYKKVTVDAVDSTQVMRLSVQDANLEVATAIAQKITEIAPDIVVDSVEAGSCKVISAARGVEAPVSPNKMRNTAIGALLGMVFSVGIVLLRSFLNNRFNTDEDVQRYLELPIIGVIPLVTDNGK